MEIKTKWLAASSAVGPAEWFTGAVRDRSTVQSA